MGRGAFRRFAPKVLLRRAGAKLCEKPRITRYGRRKAHWCVDARCGRSRRHEPRMRFGARFDEVSQNGGKVPQGAVMVTFLVFAWAMAIAMGIVSWK